MIMLPLLLAVQAASEEPQWNCADPLVQQEMNYCAQQEFLAADAEMNVQWKIAAQQMKAVDAQFAQYGGYEGDQRPGYFATLLEAQRAWLAFRDAHCRLDGYSARGGSMEPMLASFCMADLTRARTKMLREYVSAGE
ncbi:MAG: lysozyme inhibitor LprI family protein [Sphingomonadaceae bacterium]